jgi:sigma-B regulation protein RsbU (phosphoserine phosphatase)
MSQSPGNARSEADRLTAENAALQADLAARDRELEALRAAVAAERRRADAELAIARRVQVSLMPTLPNRLGPWAVAVAYEPARVVGGDFYNLHEAPDRPGTLRLAIADVTGKGITAALLMAFARAILRAAADNSDGPAEALRRANRVFSRDVRSGLFLTAFMAELEPSGEVRFASAGHEPPLLRRARTGRVTALPEGGPMLGLVDEIDPPEGRIRLEPGDLLLAYTDGVTDAREGAGRRFGEVRLRRLLRRATGGPQAIVDEIVRATCVGGPPAADDVTVVAVSRLEGSG